ncbi:MAG TPA: cytochrome c oxidase subunit 3 [Sphingomicrobium sp.]|jgi:heme/copper-type cytochrome/quinol oxidase subunit 3
MMGDVRFTQDVAELPTHKFGPSSLTWWGIIAFMVIEGMFFALAFAAYFMIMGHEQGWPPEGRQAADLIPGTLFTIGILLSEIPNTIIKKAAERYDTPAVRLWMPIMVAIGAALLIIRGFEFNNLNCRWTDDAYSSIIWALLLLHTTHLLTDWIDTIVLAALMNTDEGYEGRRFVDVDENSLYWRYVWLMWLPIYATIYLVPRL